MTTEEKAKAYDEALEKAKKYHEEYWQVDAKDITETLFPELRESEDKRIRRELIEYLRGDLDDITTDDTDRWISWLEKQKDAFENGRQLGIMQEQARQELEWTDEKRKEHQNNSDAPKKALGGALISPLSKDTILDEIAQDYVDNVKEYNPELTWDLMQTAVCYGYHYCEQKEPKHAPDDLQKSFEEGQKSIVGNPEKYGLCKKAEWSEEDEDAIQQAILALEDRYDEHEPNLCFLGYKLPFNKAAERLKSLRPSWKPSEEDKKILHAIEFHVGQLDSGETINGFSSSDMLRVLKSIYEQL